MGVTLERTEHEIHPREVSGLHLQIMSVLPAPGRLSFAGHVLVLFGRV